MKTAPKRRRINPTAESLRGLPEIDFGRYRIRRNRFARAVAASGIELRHEGPSATSLRAIPRLDFSRSRVRRNPYADNIEAAGITLQIGRRRPRAAERIGPTVTKSVRLPPVMWAELQRRARAEGLTIHALLRRAIADLVRRPA